MKFSHLLGLVALLTLFSCASGHRETSQKVRSLAVKGDFNGAISYLKKSPLAKEEKSKLLYYVELGLLQHYSGNYPESIISLNRAKETLDDLYTTRISGKLAYLLSSSDDADVYYGEKYEASLVYFYLSLNHYYLSLSEENEQQRRDSLRRARAEIVAWDSFLTEMQIKREKTAFYKHDLLVKVYGGFIHESQNTNIDNQIAIQLYKDAEVIFSKHYARYPTFNQPVDGNIHKRELQDFLRMKISSLSERLKTKQNLKEGNITIIIQDGLIAQKEEEEQMISMDWGAENRVMAKEINAQDYVTIKLPILKRHNLDLAYLQVISNKKVIREIPLTVIAPISDLAEEALKEHYSSIKSRAIFMAKTNYTDALTVSYRNYERAKQENNQAGMLNALSFYKETIKALKERDRADTRFWSTLPSSIRIGQISLPKGNYNFRVSFGEKENPTRFIDLGEHRVIPKSHTFISNKKNLYEMPKEIIQSPAPILTGK